jgi:hypothetical protein
MKNLLMLVMVIGVGVLLWNLHQDNEREAEEREQIAQNLTTAQEARAAKSPTSDPMYNADGTLKRLPPGTQVNHYWGYLVQHLSNGIILVKCGNNDARGYDRVWMTAAVVSGTAADNFVDGAEINFTGIPAGTFQYATVENAVSTIAKILYIPPEAMPTESTEGKGAPWMWRGQRNALDGHSY